MSATIKKLTVEQIFDGTHTPEEINTWLAGRGMPKEDQDDIDQFTDNFMPIILDILPEFLVGLVKVRKVMNDPLEIVSAALESGAYAYRQILQSVDPQAMLAVDKYLAQERAKTE